MENRLEDKTSFYPGQPVFAKGKSPFYPGQPVPVELFVGRMAVLNRIMARGVSQVAAGKPVAIYIQGEYGIGKSSLASVVQQLAEREYGLHGIYASLHAQQNLDGVAAAILSATVRSGAFDPKRSERIRNWLAKYIGEQSLFGLNLNLQALKQNSPQFNVYSRNASISQRSYKSAQRLWRSGSFSRSG
jgi:hypothetical protein